MTHQDQPSLLLAAIAFAARAHNGQIRKDGKTPYVSHAFRVCMIARNEFGISDQAVLAAAVLHDTIEDTTTDHDDLAKHFGRQVADWVAALSKDKRLSEAEREAAYGRTLAESPWQVQICKLADILDNLQDSGHLSTQHQQRTLRNARRYSEALTGHTRSEAAHALEIVKQAVAKQSQALAAASD